MKNNFETQNQCKVSERNDQLVFALDSENMIPENAPVRLASAMLEELDYEKLYGAYSPHCAENRRLPLQKENNRLVDGWWQAEAWYRCESAVPFHKIRKNGSFPFTFSR